MANEINAQDILFFVILPAPPLIQFILDHINPEMGPKISSDVKDVPRQMGSDLIIEIFSRGL